MITKQFNTHKERVMSKLSASEAVYGFVGWLTTRDTPVTMSRSDDCAGMATLIAEFCEANSLEDPCGDWHLALIHPSGEVGKVLED